MAPLTPPPHLALLGGMGRAKSLAQLCKPAQRVGMSHCCGALAALEAIKGAKKESGGKIGN